MDPRSRKSLRLKVGVRTLVHLNKKCLVILGDPGGVRRAGRKGATKVFKYGPGTDSHRAFSKNSSGCQLLIGHKKCFVLLWSMGTKNTSLSLQQVFTLASVTSSVNINEFLKDTRMAANHENFAWKKGIRIFSVSIVIIPTCLLCQMQADPSGAEFLSTIPKFMKRMNFVIACLRPSKNMKLGIFTDSRAVGGKEMYKKGCCTCKVVVLPCQAIAYLTFSSPPHL